MTKVFFKFLTIFSFCIFYSNAQNLTRNHIVKKGETVYRLSKTYNVSIADIIKLNPSASGIIYIGEVLKIPTSILNSNQATSITNQNTTTLNNLIAYKVKLGDTKFGLSKKFGVSITNLEIQNPHIKKGLQSGHVLMVKNSNYAAPTRAISTNTNQKTGILKWHEVMKGDTFYSISKSYKVDLTLLMSANTSVIPEKIAIGSQIKIPNQEPNSTTLSLNKKEYLVKKGDTKYSLAKLYNTTIDKLESLNPQIVDMLRSGVTIVIPSPLNTQETVSIANQTTSQEVQFETSKDTLDIDLVAKAIKDSINNTASIKINDSNNNSDIKELTSSSNDSIDANSTSLTKGENNDVKYKNYVVEPKQTLYGLSKEAGMSIPEFLKLNPQLSESVIVGTIIKMPKSNFSSNSLVEENNTSNAIYTDLIPLISATKSKNILLLMPFNELEYNYYTENKSIYNAISTPKLKDHIQFYKGAKIAVDSLSKLGINMNINLLKIVDTNTSNVIDNIDLRSYDAIITNRIDDKIITLLSSKNKTDIPIITLHSEFKNYAIGPIFHAVPSIYNQKLKTLDYLNTKAGNIIVISDFDRIDSRLFIAKHSPNAKMVVTNKKDEYSVSDVSLFLDKNKVNYIIIDSKKNGVFLSSTTYLLGQISTYDLQLVVLESSLIPNNQQISSKRFRILKMVYPDINQVTNTNQTLDYFSDYKLKYKEEPSNSSLQGFDITIDTALRLSQDTDFTNSALTYKTSYLTLKFDYKKNDFMIFDNNEIIIREFKE